MRGRFKYPHLYVVNEGQDQMQAMQWNAGKPSAFFAVWKGWNHNILAACPTFEAAIAACDLLAGDNELLDVANNWKPRSKALHTRRGSARK